MARNIIKLQSILASGTMLLGLATAPVTNAVAQADIAVEPNEIVGGMTYGDWAAAWWQWVLPIPLEVNPLFDVTGENCAEGQSSSPVFFLAGSFVNETPDPTNPFLSTVVRDDCIVPAGKYLFFPILNVAADTTPTRNDPPDALPTPHGIPIGNQREEAAFFANLIDLNSLSFPLEVIVDDETIMGIEEFRAQSPTYTYNLPPGNIQGVPKGQYFGTTDGYWMMLEPLAPGAHTIKFSGSFALEGEVLFALSITYNLCVEECP